MRLVAVITTLTALSMGWTMARAILTLHPRRLVRHARSRQQMTVPLDDQ